MEIISLLYSSVSLSLAFSLPLPPSPRPAAASPFSTPWRCLSPAVIYRKPTMTRLIVTTRRPHGYLLLSSRINETRSWRSPAALIYARRSRREDARRRRPRRRRRCCSSCLSLFISFFRTLAINRTADTPRRALPAARINERAQRNDT